MKTPFTATLFSRLLGIGLLLTSCTLAAQELQTLKFNGVWAQTPTNYFIGNSDSRHALAISDKWILAGTPSADEQALNQGAVQVYNAVTGAWVRKLLPPTPVTAGEYFGDICVIAGNLAVISADRSIGAAKVYIYDLITGKKVRELTVPSLVSGDSFGRSIAVSGDWVLVGARGSDVSRGAAYLFSLRTGALITRLQPPASVSGDLFGWSVAMDGSLAVIAAPGDSSDKGCAYLYDLSTTTLVKKLIPTTAVASDSAGQQGVAITGGKVLLSCSTTDVGKIFVVDIVTNAQRVLSASDGSPNNSLGISLSADSGLAVAGTSDNKAYVFDLRSASNTETRILRAVDNPFGYFSRASVAIHQGTVLCTGESDDTLADGSGAVYLFRTLTRPLPMTQVAERGDFAPGAAETTFNKLGDAFINPEGEVAFTSTLTGPGSNGGKDNGLWSTQRADLPVYPSGVLNLVLKSRNTYLGGTVSAVSRPLFNRPFMSLYQIKFPTGPFNTAVIMKDDGVTTERLKQNAFGTPDVLYPSMVQSHLADRAAYTVTLKQGYNGVTAANDSGLVILKPSETNPISDNVRESFPIGATGENYGQFTGRAALYSESVVYAAALASSPATNQAIFRKSYGSAEVRLARKGEVAFGAAAFYSTFIGETSEDLQTDLFRATLSTPATAADNEGLWTRDSAGTYKLVLRKGYTALGLNGLKVAGFIHFWESNEQTLALVKLSGLGVTSANDQALLLYQTIGGGAGTILVLMREGDPAPGCPGTTIGTISRVEVETFYGQYLVLATLAGAPTGSNQCLFRGATRKDALTTEEQYLRRPVAILRKGELFTDRPSRLKSISLPTTNITAAGAGSTGLSTAMQQTNGGVTPNNIVLTLEFDNGVRQIMKGIP